MRRGRRIPVARWTPARHAWLRTVARGVDVRRRGKGCTGADCMRLGWVAWEWSADRSHVLGERLTRTGRRTLAQWDKRYPAGVDATQ